VRNGLGRQESGTRMSRLRYGAKRAEKRFL
jgi:hypothetical protein